MNNVPDNEDALRGCTRFLLDSIECGMRTGRLIRTRWHLFIDHSLMHRFVRMKGKVRCFSLVYIAMSISGHCKMCGPLLTPVIYKQCG